MSNRRKIDNKNGENVQNYNNNAENVEKLQKKLMELEEDTQNVYNRTKDYKKIETMEATINANSDAIVSMASRLGTAESNISNVSSATNTNAQSINTLSADVSSLSNSLASHVADYNSLNQRHSNLVEVVSGHGTHISTAEGNILALQSGKQDKLTAGTGISIDANNVISSGSGNVDLSQIQGQINSLGSRVFVLETKVAELCPEYNEVITKQSDTYTRDLDISAENEVVTPSVLFAMQEYLTYQDENDITITEYQKAKIVFDLSFEVSAADTVTFAVYNKSTLLRSVTKTVEQSGINTTQNIIINTVASVTEKNQNVYVVCTTANQSTTITLTHMQANIVAPDAIILNKISPFEVMFNYYTNKYYFSDCTTGFAKLAEIDANQFTSLADLTWTTTNIEAQNYKTYLVPQSTDSTTFIKYAIIVHKNNTAEIVNVDDNTKRYTYPLGTYKVEPYPTRNGYLMVNYICANRNTINTKYNIIQHTMVVTNTINFGNAENLADISSTRNNLPYISFGATWVHVLVNSNIGGTRFYINRTSATNPEVILPFSQGGKIYLCKFVSEYNMQYHTYIKQFDKFYVFGSSVSGFSFALGSKTLVGEYDDLFEGLNGSLFVVRSNQLQYIPSQNQ